MAVTEAKSGCDGASQLSVEMQPADAFSPWTTVLSLQPETYRLDVHGLNAAGIYRIRLRARNAIGMSQDGEVSLPARLQCTRLVSLIKQKSHS